MCRKGMPLPAAPNCSATFDARLADFALLQGDNTDQLTVRNSAQSAKADEMLSTL